MKREYHEGPEATARFEKLATQLFRAPKPTAKPAAKKVRTAKENQQGLMFPLASPLPTLSVPRSLR
jgi:hypothetical protein